MTTALTVRVSDEVAHAVRTYAFVTGSSETEVVERAVSEYLQAYVRTDLVQKSFERVLRDHAQALEKLASL